MDFLPHWLKPFETFLIGLVGALVALPSHGLKDIKTAMVFLLSGAFCAEFLTGLALSVFGVDPEHSGGVTFLVGAFGGSLIAACIRTIQKADIWGTIVSIIKSKFGAE